MSPSIHQLLLHPSRAVHEPHTIENNRLGHRPNPKLPGHDSNGFRNVSVPKEAKIVALGDSQTYGAGVEPTDAWLRQLEYLMKKPVYRMAYGGYGPAHSLILWEEAASLNPDIYLEAFYSGNDLYDSFKLVYSQGKLPELKAANKNIEMIGKRRSQNNLFGSVIIFIELEGIKKNRKRQRKKIEVRYITSAEISFE